MGYIFIDFKPVSLLWIFGIIIFLVLIFTFLIQKSDRIINALKLDQGFDDNRIELGNFNKENILQLALILIGGFLIIDYAPVFLHFCFLAFKSKVSRDSSNLMNELFFGRTQDYFNWTIAGLNIILGYLLLTNTTIIIKWLTRKEKKKIQESINTNLKH
ncbi:hypothetical protein DMZ48_02525 [Robertkochia solimangrovi]|nr:hypothetical protein DMZ48_02525 [Robertkochia solimangrovi]